MKLARLDKKIIITLSALVGAVVIGIIIKSIVTSAYLSDKTNVATNYITVGSVETHIEEDAVNISGKVINKAPKVVNDGRNPCLVRVRLDVSPSNIVDKMTTNYQLDNWIDGKDGYYYYKKVLEPNKTTEAVFTTIRGLTDDDGRLVDGLDIFDNEFSINVYQEAIQNVVYRDEKEYQYSYNSNTPDDKILENMRLLWEHYEAGNE